MFKVNDKVKCIKQFEDGCPPYVGGTYTIEDMHFNNNTDKYQLKLKNIDHKDHNVYNRFFPSYGFELIEKVQTNFEKNIELLFHNFKANHYQEIPSLPIYIIEVVTEILKPINKTFEGKMWTSVDKFPTHTIKAVYIYSIGKYASNKIYWITYDSSDGVCSRDFDLVKNQFFFKSNEEAQKYIDNI